MEFVTVATLLRNGDDVVSRVENGETLLITRGGRAVAQLCPVPRSSPPAAELIARRRHLPRVDPDHLRRDVDSGLDSSL